MAKDININDIPVYTTLSFQNDDITITIKNLLLDELPLFTNKEIVVKSIMYYFWFTHGNYDSVFIKDTNIEVVILSRTKKKIELMVKR